MTTALTYTVAGSGGDYATWALAATAIGAQNFTVSSTGNVTAAVVATNLVALALTETADFTGHPVTIGGVTRLIGSYNTTTRIGTLTAKAGFPGTWPVAPGLASAYTVADIAVTVQGGQASAGSNTWVLSGTVTWSGATTGASNTLTLSGNTAWSATAALNWNRAGSASQPVLITGSLGSDAALFDVQIDNTTVQNLQFVNTSAGGRGLVGNHNFNVVNCWMQCVSGNFFDPAFLLYAAATVNIRQSVFYSLGTSGDQTLCGAFIGTVNLFGCTFVRSAYAVYSDNSGVLNATGCAFYLQSLGVRYPPKGPVGYTACATDGTATTGLFTVGTASANFVATTDGGLDLRPVVAAAIINNANAGTNSNNLTDIFGVTRSLTHPTFGAAENGFAPPATSQISYLAQYNGDLQTFPKIFQGTGAWASATGLINITAVTSGTIQIGDILNTNDNNSHPVSLLVTGFTGSGSGTTGTYPVTQWHIFPPTDGFSSPVTVDTITRTVGPNLTYFQTGQTCPSTAAGSGQIVLAAPPLDCIGHPVQSPAGSGNSCIIGSYNTTTFVATIATPPAGSPYSATFAGTPQAGDTYTILPINVEIIGALSAATNREYDVPGTGSTRFYQGAVMLNSQLKGTTNTINFAGNWAFDPAVALGTIVGAGSTSALAIATSGQYESVIAVQTTGGTVLLSDMQLYSKNVQGFEAGCIRTDTAWGGTGTWRASRVLMRSDGPPFGTDHPAGVFFDNLACIADNCIVIGCTPFAPALNNQFTPVNCLIVCTKSATATVAPAGAASGQATIAVLSVTNLVVGMFIGAKPGVINQTLGVAPTIQSINPGASPNPTITLTNNLVGSLSSLDGLTFGSLQPMFPPSAVLTNDILLGSAAETYGTSTNTYVGCETDLSGVSGAAQITFATAYAGLFQVGTTAPDARSTNGYVPHSTATDARTGGVDIFGNPRGANSSTGPINLATAGGNMMLLGVG